MKINYIVDERIEFFSSLLTVNGYWDFLAKKFWGEELMKHPYKDEVINFFSEFKNHELFSLLESICENLHDFSILLEIPFFFLSDNKDLPSDCNISDEIRKNKNFKKTLILMEDLYHKSNYNMFFSKLDKTSFYLSDKQKEKISKCLDSLQTYLNIKLGDVRIFISPLILGNYLIPLFNSEISIAISPYDYQDRYIWGMPEDYILKFVIKNISTKAIFNLRESLNIQQNNISCNIPYYNNWESIVSNILSRIILIRLRTLLNKEDEKLLLEKDSKDFPDIAIYYKRLVENETDCKFCISSVDRVFMTK